jgi:hypothetical protein
MMRWKYIELPKGEYPPQIATKHGNGWVILQERIVKTEIRWDDGAKWGIEHKLEEWQDVPLHIESKE